MSPISDPAESTPEIVRVEREGGIATVIINRPKAMNALSFAVRSRLCEVFDSLRDEDEIGVVILTGAGDRAFTAGLDLKELGGDASESTSSAAGAVESGADVIRTMAALRKPLIGAINGVAITGGFEIALGCDVLIGSTAARFADTHARVGILPGWGLSQKLSRLIGIHRAKELSLTGNFLDAEQAERWGVLNRVVEPEDLLPVCRKVAQDMLSCPRDMLVAYKDVIDRGYAETFADGCKLERETNRAHMTGVSPEAIRGARSKVMERGRTQSGDGSD